MSGRVHRFHDKVAVYIGTGATVYLEPKQARAFARAMVKAAQSCEKESFAESSGLSQSFNFDNEVES